MLETLAGRVEDLDPLTRADENAAVVGMDGQRLRQPVAVLAQDGPAGQVDLQQGAPAGGGPQLAAGVQAHVEQGIGQGGQRSACRAAAGADPIKAAAIRTATGQHGTVGQGEDRQRSNLAMALADPRGKRFGRKRPQHRGKFRRLRRVAGRGNRLEGLHEQPVGRRLGIRRRRFAQVKLRRRLEGRHGPQIDTGTVVRRRDAEGRLLAIPGVVGRQGQKLVAAARLTLKDGRQVGGLPAKDFEAAAVHRRVHRHMLDARSPHLVRGRPLDKVVRSAGGQRRDAGGRRRGRGVDLQRDRVGVLGRRRVEQHPRAGLDRRPRGDVFASLDGEADQPAACPLGIVGYQQAHLAVLQQLARLGIDGLQQPGGCGRTRVDPGGHPQDKSLGVDEVKIALEKSPVGGNVDVDVAHAEVAQPEGARIQVGIQGGHHADLSHGRGGIGCVLEVDGEGQRLADRDELVGTGRQGADHRGQGIGRRVARQKTREVGGGHLDKSRFVQAGIAVRHKDLEGLKVRGAGQAQVELAAAGRGRPTDPLSVVSVPGANLLEETDQVALGHDLLARRSGE